MSNIRILILVLIFASLLNFCPCWH